MNAVVLLGREDQFLYAYGRCHPKVAELTLYSAKASFQEFTKAESSQTS